MKLQSGDLLFIWSAWCLVCTCSVFFLFFLQYGDERHQWICPCSTLCNDWLCRKSFACCIECVLARLISLTQSWCTFAKISSTIFLIIIFLAVCKMYWCFVLSVSSNCERYRCFVIFVRLQEIMDYSHRHCEKCGGSGLFLSWFCNEVGAGCFLLPEFGHFLLPLNFGINRMFLQFHSCIVP